MGRNTRPEDERWRNVWLSFLKLAQVASSINHLCTLAVPHSQSVGFLNSSEVAGSVITLPPYLKNADLNIEIALTDYVVSVPHACGSEGNSKMLGWRCGQGNEGQNVRAEASGICQASASWHKGQWVKKSIKSRKAFWWVVSNKGSWSRPWQIQKIFVCFDALQRISCEECRYLGIFFVISGALKAGGWTSCEEC